MPQLTLEKQPQTQNTTVASPFDNEMVNAIRDGKLVAVPWSQLTSEEKRAAHVAFFRPCNW